MTAERARDIIHKGRQFAEYRAHMTPAEIREVMELWLTMDGRTCFFDALNRIAKGDQKGGQQ